MCSRHRDILETRRYLILPQPNAVHATKQGVLSLLLFALKRLSEEGKCFFPAGGKTGPSFSYAFPTCFPPNREWLL